MITRRELLGVLTAFGVAATLPEIKFHSQSKSPSVLEPMPVRFSWIPDGGKEILLDVTQIDIQNEIQSYDDGWSGHVINRPTGGGSITINTNHWWDVDLDSQQLGTLRVIYSDEEILNSRGRAIVVERVLEHVNFMSQRTVIAKHF